VLLQEDMQAGFLWRGMEIRESIRWGGAVGFGLKVDVGVDTGDG